MNLRPDTLNWSIQPGPADSGLDPQNNQATVFGYRMGAGTMKCYAELGPTERAGLRKTVHAVWKMVCAGKGQKVGFVTGETQSDHMDRQRKERVGASRVKVIIPAGVEEVCQVCGAGPPRRRGASAVSDRGTRW